MKYDIIWFKKTGKSILKDYLIEYRSFKEGDFGALERIDFSGNGMGGSIDFWSSDWLGLYLYSYKLEKSLLNVLLEPHQQLEKEKAFKEFADLVM